MSTYIQKNKGNLLVLTLIFASVSVYILSALVTSATTNLKLSKQMVNRELALQVAEAGIDYYRWHLAHAPNDYTDGTSTPGPYVHEYYDKDGNNIGRYTLTITPPIVGSTLTTIKSKGEVYVDPSISRTIQEQLAIPSFARFAVVANDEMRFGEGTEVFGPIQSNGGIRFDGLAHNIVSSALATYTDPDSGQYSYGVHTTVSPSDPSPSGGSTVPNRPDIFIAGRTFPVAAADFAGITASLAQIKTQAQASGRYFAPSGYYGYHIVLKTDDTFDLYRVTNVLTPPSNCTNYLSQTGWGTWSIATGGETFIQNYSIPSNGLIFLEDNVWVDGQISGARVTIAAGTFPDNASTRKSIIVNRDLLYTNLDGTDVISLVAQNNILVGLKSSNTLTIDAALMAQNGFVGRYYYRSYCGTEYMRSTLNLFGMIGTNQRYGFAYTDNTGYDIRNLTYDANLLYAPPPSFPLSTNQYEIISWKEI
jgi:hypothetical protein